MRDRIISNIMIKFGVDLNEEQKRKLEVVLCEELKDVNITKASTEVAKYDCELEKLKNQFLACLSIENKSMRTILQYNVHLQQFIDYTKPKQATEIDATDIRSFLFGYKRSRNISDVSLNNKRSAISSFFTWLTDEEYIPKDPTRKIKKIKVAKTIKKAYSNQELEHMRMKCKSIRDRAILEILDCTGCRVSEVVNMNLSDIDFKTKSILVLGKGNKERTVFISERAMPYLELYLNTRDDDMDALFLTKRHPFNRIGKDGIERVIRQLGKECGIKAHPHKHRRTFCTNLINRGMPAQDVAILMGHEDVNMTCSVYYDASVTKLAYEYNKYIA